MTPSPDGPDHTALRELLGAHALGALDGPARAEVEAHLPGCPDCRAELAAIAPLAGPLARLGSLPRPDDRLPDDPLPDDARHPSTAGFAAILGRIDAERPGPVLRQVVPDPAPRRRRPWLVAAVGVVVALAGLGAGFGLGLDAARDPVRPAVVQALRPGVQADAGTIAHTWGVEVVLTARGLDSGRVYEVAVVDRAGRPVGAGAFVGTGAKEMVCRLSSPVLPAEATGFVVTTEQGEQVLRSAFA